jgi:hypothetical protein
MPNYREVLTRALEVADAVNDYLPGAKLSQAAIDLGRKTEDLLKSFGEGMPLEDQEKAQAARKVLSKTVADKARALSASLRGK